MYDVLYLIRDPLIAFIIPAPFFFTSAFHRRPVRLRSLVEFKDSDRSIESRDFSIENILASRARNARDRSPKWPLSQLAHSFRFHGNALAGSHPPLHTVPEPSGTSDWTNERERMNGISQGSFCTTFSCFFFAYTSDELVRGTPEGEDVGKRSDKERERA